MLPHRFEDKLTPASREEVFNALYKAWLYWFESPPKRDSVILLIAHWALETGWGKHMHCNNLGNQKSREGDGHDFCYFTCGEEVPFRTARAWEEASPETVSILRTYILQMSGKAVTMASVLLSPDHYACRFRAYEHLEDGAVDYMQMLHVRFAAAWPFVESGDPVGFVHTLKQHGYFTAAEAPYVKAVKTIFEALQTGLDVDIDALPVLSESEKLEAMNLVAVTMGSMDLHLHEGTHAEEEDD